MHSTKTYNLGGLTLVEISGQLTHQALWYSLGQYEYVATFELEVASAAHAHYGASIVGTVAYTMDDRRDMSQTYNPAAIRIDCRQPELAVEARKSLKYHGIALADICTVSFVPMQRPNERHASGEKVVPNVVEIPYEHDPRVDFDRLTQSYLVGKHNDGIGLAPYEKNQLIGITLGLNGGHIDRRILKQFGYDAKTAAESIDIAYHRYQTKQRHGGLTDVEQKYRADVEDIRSMHAVIAVIKEIRASQLTEAGLAKAKIPIGEVMQSAREFHPSILLHGRPQVFWDLESYLHIAMRHVRDFQIGQFRQKSAFPYRFADLELLIEKVLKNVADEIEQHFQQSANAAFTRHGRMSTHFNGDYYSFRIELSGRLTTLYVCTDRNDGQG